MMMNKQSSSWYYLVLLLLQLEFIIYSVTCSITITSTPTTSTDKLNDLIHQLKSSNIKSSSLHKQSSQYSTNRDDEQTFLFNVEPLGTLKGLESAIDNYKSFKTIPYAQSPGGEWRWTDPRPQPLPFQSILDATQFGPMCPQNCLLPHGLCAVNQSEDCLSLNVFTPFNITSTSPISLDRKMKVNGLKPVMVFFPGGHFDQGTANCPLYDGRYFVSKGDVILVTVNYRLGSLGYLVSLENNILGNFALKDQRLALKWVQSYISYFGGDPNRVTIFGESAGAGSVTSLIMNKASEGLFHQAIFQSNPLSLPFRDLKSLDNLGNRFIQDSKCKDLNCLKSLPFSDIVKYSDSSSNHLSILHPIISFMPWTPAIDGNELLEQPLDAFKNGNYFKIPIMMGTCSEEAIMFVYLALSTPLNSIEYDGALLGLFGTSYFKVHSMYQPQGNDQRVEFSVLGTDYIFTAPTRNAMASIHSHQNATIPIFLFEFNHTLSFSAAVFKERYPFCIGHVCHGSELPLVFHSSQYVNLYLTQDEEILSNQMIQYWTNFAYSANPNIQKDGKYSNNLPIWNPFTPSNLLNMEFQTPKSSMIQGLRRKQLDMFDSIGYHHGY